MRRKNRDSLIMQTLIIGKLSIGAVKFHNNGMIQAVIGICK